MNQLERGTPAHDQRVARYIELGKQWAAGQRNRMIKVPATPAGLGAPPPRRRGMALLVGLVALAGVTLITSLTIWVKVAGSGLGTTGLMSM